MSAQTVEINSIETVLRELNPLVEEVQRTLEQSLENDQPAEGAAGVTARLTEIRGTLVLLDLEGPRLLVEEMRELADALSQGAVQGQDATLEVLLKAVFKLPDYLDRLLAGRSDRPAVLLPLINELRGARGAEPLGERDVFRPQLDPVAPQRVTEAGVDDAEIRGAAKRLRPRFQKALLGWYRGENIETHLNELGSVLQELAQSTSNPATQRLWYVCGALTESLSDQGLEQDTSVKVLMAKVERLLSQLVRQGEGALEQTIPLDLLRSLLYYVARSGSDSPRVRDVKDAYNLEELLPDSGAEADFEGPNRGLLEVVGQGIRDELTSIRDAVEIYVHSEESRPDVLEGLPERIRQVADTFSMVGLSDDHDLLRQEAEALAEIDSVDAEQVNSRMQRLADVLVRADSDLTELESGRRSGERAADDSDLAIRDLPDSEYRPLLSAVVAASLDDLSKLREAIGAYCGDPDAGRDAVTEAPALLNELEGAVAILPLEAALPLVRDLRDYTQRELVERGVRPDDETQVLIADVVAGLEYYLEAVDHDRAAMTHLLESARRAMEALQSGGEPETYSGDEQVVIESAGPEADSAEEGEAEASAAAPAETTEAEEQTIEAEAPAQAAGDASAEPAAAEAAPPPDSPTESGESAQEAEAAPAGEETDLGDLDLADTETGDADGADTEAAELDATSWDTGDVELDLADDATATSTTEVDGSDAGEIDLSELDAGEGEASEETESSDGDEPELDVAELDTGEQEIEAEASGPPAGEAAETPAAAEGASDDEALDIADLDTGDLDEQTGAADTSEVETEIDELGDLDFEEPEASASQGPGEAEGGASDAADELELLEASDVDAGELEDADSAGAGEQDTAAVKAELEPDADDESASVVEVAGEDESVTLSLGVAGGGSGAQAASGEEAGQTAELDADEGQETRAGPGVDPAASGSQYAIVGEDVDDEIVEVFLEEALGELDKINAYLPRWKADPSDEESLVVVRRAFHTLKGGGRLIGAELVGEFSWSMENMLNRVIDHSIDATSTLFETLDEAAAALPQLIEQIRGNRSPIEGIDDLIQRAHALSRGEEPPPRGGGGGASGPDAGSSGNGGGSGSASREEARQSPSTAGAEAPRGEHETLAAAAETPQATGVAEDEAATANDRHEPAADEPASAEGEAGDALSSAFAAAPSEPTDAGEQGSEQGVGASVDVTDAMTPGEQADDGDVLLALAGDDVELDEATPEVSFQAEATDAAPGAGEGIEALGSEVDDAIPTESDRVADPESASAEAEAASGRDDGPVESAPASSSRVESSAEVSTTEAAAAETETVDPTELDDELLDSFLEEADELLEAADAAAERLRENPDDTAAIAELQRYLHTLKGGARMADLAPIGELTHELESLLHGVDEGSCERSDALFDVLQEAIDGLSAMAMQVRAQQPVAPADQLLQRIRALITGQGRADAGAPSAPDDEPAEELAAADESTAASDSLGVDAPVEMVEPSRSEVAEDAPAEGATAAGQEIDWLDEADAELVESFLEEADELVDSCEQAASRWRDNPDDEASPDELQRHLHTLKGGARMASLTPLGELTHELESLIHAVDSGERAKDEPFFEALQAAIDHLMDQMSRTRARQPLASPEGLIDKLRRLRAGESIASGGEQADEARAEQAAQRAPEPATGEPASATEQSSEDDIVSIFAREADSHHAVLTEQYLDADGEPIAQRRSVKPDLLRALHTLVGSAETAGCNAIAALVAPMEQIVKLRRDAKSDLTEQDTQLFGEAVQTLGRLLAELVEEPDQPLDTSALQRRLSQQRDQAQADLDATQDESEGELVDVFLEEADELLEACDQGAGRWREQPDDEEVLSELQRSLHTLKGGARMANLPPIADLTHEVEALIKAAEDGQVSAGEELFELLQESVDALTVLLEQVRGRQPIARVDWLIEEIQNLRERAGVAAPATTPGPSAERAQRQRDEAAPAEVEQASAAETVPSTGENAPAGSDEKAEKGAAESAGKSEQTGKDQQGAGSQAGSGQAQSGSELIRVQADLLDNLVNYAGEVSIYHSRLGEQMGQYRFNLNEFEQTVNRLREQLRQMEDETEAQILYSGEKHEQEDQPKREDFDPLEFDRYTRIQELSRSLSESVGDLDSIKEILENLTRDAETLLLQQSRVSSELQDGLMQTRMVRFDGLRARLNRVVRQTASQVGKKVQMAMTGGELEVDRSIQERVVAPLEHVLRNAVSHGIESPSERRQAGKAEQGSISIDLHRGGTDVILEISDDGAGIDPDAVRRKAINRGLINADDDRDDNEVIKLILETGFSTADEVTQISGRGVGMDVVDAEIRRLGGTLGISTVKGQGSQFTIRLPVTLAINQAVLVKAGDDTYAIPIASIDGVTQVTAGELKQYYIDPSRTLTYAEAEYRVQHLGSLLGTSEPKLDQDDVSYPVIMVRSGDERVALHIENIQGRREVVVKPLGTPLNMLPGISGATIMADGSVVLILDVGGLLRTESRFVAATAPEEAEPAEEEADAEGAASPTVLVVDDSITMRKVSQRILTRNGFEVGTAKDGVDAMSWMSQQVPDLILLDIEMPRMDGYEVAVNVRSDDRLNEVPIIMVTSRTGDKHRQRAQDIGVNQYLGKPYQEAELMEEINALLATPEPA